MLKKTLFTIIFFVFVAVGFLLLNNNTAYAVSDKWSCKWYDSGQIECRKPSDLTSLANSFLQGGTELFFSGTPISEWAGDKVQDWQNGVLTNFDNIQCVEVVGACKKFWYMPEQSEARGYPVYCWVNDQGNAEGDQGSDEGCIHFASNNPLLAYHTGPNEPLSGAPADSEHWWPVAGIENATNNPDGNRCGFTNPGTCIPKNRSEFTGAGLNTDTFEANVEAIQALEALKEACEREAPLSFITCPIFNGVNEAISQLIGGQQTTGAREGLLIDFLTISPLTGSQGQNVMQSFVGQVVNIANFIYIIVFLLLIFSSSLPLGLDNYTIKKMLPKFIAAVILTQFSFVICQIVIDFFNLMGTVVPNLIFALRLGSATLQGGATGGSLIGTGLGAAITAGLASGALGFLAAGGWIIIIILAFIALIAILVAFVYMVLRYLVIYILVIISPLAFVAWVLPGTEKFFFNWWKNFIKVNAVFPVVTGMLAIAIVLSQVLVADPNANNIAKLVAMLIPIVALFMVPKTLKWTTQGMNALAAGALGFAAGKMGAGAGAVGKGAKATGKYAKSAGKDAANDYRTKKAGEMFGRGNKAGGALLMGKLPTKKGTHQAREAASKAEREVAERNQASLAAGGNSLQGLDLTGGVGGIEAQLRARNPKLTAAQANKQAQQIHQAALRHGVDPVTGQLVASQGNDLYGLELQRVAMGQGSDLLGVSSGDHGMQTSAVSELAQRGDFNLIHDAVQSGSLDQSTMMKGIQPNFGDVMAKAPDLVKGAGGAYNNIGAEKIAQLDRYSTERMIAHVSNGANFVDHTGAIDPVAHAAAVQNLHNEAARMGSDPRIVAGMDPRARASLNNFLTATGQPTI